MKQKWLNLILHLSGIIYKKKSSISSANPIKIIVIFFQLIFLEFIIAVASFPMYLFIRPDEIGDKFGVNSNEVRIYQLRRKITFATVGIFLITLAVKTAFVFYGTINSPKESSALTEIGNNTSLSQELEETPMTEINSVPTQENNSNTQTIENTEETGNIASENFSVVETKIDTPTTNTANTENTGSNENILSTSDTKISQETPILTSTEETENTQQTQETSSPNVTREVKVELPINYYIPDQYIKKPKEKVEAYHKLTSVHELQLLNQIKSDLSQKYGTAPQEVTNLFDVIELKILSKKTNIISIDHENNGNDLILTMENKIEYENIKSLLNDNPKWTFQENKLKINKTDLDSNWINGLKESIKLLASN